MEAERMKAKAAAEETRDRPKDHIREDWELSPPECPDCGDLGQAIAYNVSGTWHWDWDCSCGGLRKTGLPRAVNVIKWPFRTVHAYEEHWKAAGFDVV